MLPCGQEPVYAIEDRGPRPPGPSEISARTPQRASVHRAEATAPGGSAGAAAEPQTEVPWYALPLTVTQPTLLACADWLRESAIPLGPIPRGRYDRVVARAGTTIWWLTDQDVTGGPRPLAAVEVPEPLRRAADAILAEQARSRLKTEVRRRRHGHGPMQHGVGR